MRWRLLVLCAAMLSSASCQRSLVIGLLDEDGGGVGVADAATDDLAAPDLLVPPPSRVAFGRAIPYPVDPGPRALAVTDLDKDGRVDIAVGGDNGGTIFLNTGNGLFDFGHPVGGAGTVALDARDIDQPGDQYVDLVWAFGRKLAAARGAAGGMWVEGWSLTLTHDPLAVVIVDLNHLDKLDFLAGVSDGVISVVDGRFGAHPVTPTGNIGRLRRADLDRDGNEEVVALSTGQSAYVLQLDGNGGVRVAPNTAVPFSATGGPATDVVALDDDRDGNLDLVACVSADGSQTGLRLARGLGAAPWFGPVVSSTAVATPAVLATADLDGDGRTDLVGGNAAGSTVAVFGPLGGGSVEVQPIPQLADVIAVAAADLDGDGRQDIVALMKGDDHVWLVHNRAP